jgi:tyrosyl-tRNA synthetase
MEMPAVEEQLKLIEENCAEIITGEELQDKLQRSFAEKRPLRCKLGIDPSAPDIHLGHAVVLHKMKTFQELGHQLVIILGDFTGQIGDPTDRSETRPQLTREEVLANARTYQEQIFKIIDREKTELLFNSQWLAALNFSEVIKLAATCTVARILEREDFANRYRGNLPIGIHEFFYPLMQGYDSIAVKADIEFGATEQKFNLLMGRHLQKEFGQEPQVALTMPILVGTDGVQKMSKSLGNYIGISDPPEEIYGKVMSISDEIMADYYHLATRLSSEEVKRIIDGYQGGKIHPRDAKMRLAREIVSLYHGAAAAARAEEGFKQVFQRGKMPSEMEVFKISAAASPDLVSLLVRTALTSSKSEARRLIRQGGIRVNGEQVKDMDLRWQDPAELVLQVGKRKFARVIITGKGG